MEIRFDDGAAAHAAAVVRSAIATTEELLSARRIQVHDLGFWWEGYAQRWFDQLDAGVEVVAAATLQHLRVLVGEIDASRATARSHRAAQHAARVQRAELQRQQAEAARAAAAEHQRLDAAAAAAAAAKREAPAGAPE